MQHNSARRTLLTSTAASLPVTAVAILAASMLTACSTGPDRISRTTIRASAAVAQDFESDLSGLGYSDSFDTDYESVEVGIGATFFDTGSNIDDAYGRKISRAELLIGKAQFDVLNTLEVDAIELSGGGRYFFGSHPTFQPFLSAHATGTYFEDIDDFELGIQLGLRAGGGVEFALSDNVFLDAGIDYTVPLIAAESDEVLGVSVDTEVSGWAVRVGLGFIF